MIIFNAYFLKDKFAFPYRYIHISPRIKFLLKSTSTVKFISSSPSPSRSVLSSILPYHCRGLSLLSSFGYFPLYKELVICLDNSHDDGPLFFRIAYKMMFHYLFCYLIQSCSIIFTCLIQWLVTDWTVRGSNPGGGEFFHTIPDRPWGPPRLLYNGYRVFHGGKRPGRGVVHRG
jgi:hypothetical protein